MLKPRTEIFTREFKAETNHFNFLRIQNGKNKKYNQQTNKMNNKKYIL